MDENIAMWIDNNQLVTITVVKSKAGRKTVIGRIVHFQPEQGSLLVYDVDHKITHHLKLNEIDEIVPA